MLLKNNTRGIQARGFLMVLFLMLRQKEIYDFREKMYGWSNVSGEGMMVTGKH